MSKEAAQSFVLKLIDDPATATRLNIQNRSVEETAGTAVELGRQHGLVFTGSEFIDVVNASERVHDGELSDDVLEAISGGSAKTIVGKIWAALGGKSSDGGSGNCSGGLRG